MNTTFQRSMLAALITLTVGAGTAMAANPEKDPGQKSPTTSGDPSMAASPAMPAATGSVAYDKFNALDANHDGSVDRQEADASKELSAQFAKLDKNNDSKLSITEFNNASNMAMIKVDNKTKGY